MKIKNTVLAVLCTTLFAFAPMTMAHWHKYHLKVNPCELSKYPLRYVSATNVNGCSVLLSPGSKNYVGVKNVYKNGMKLKRDASCAELDVGNPVKRIHRYTNKHGRSYYDLYICKPIVPRVL